MQQSIFYSDRYRDDKYEYRHVCLPAQMARLVPAGALLAEHEWRSLGVQQSRGWAHYACFQPKTGLLLFRRPLKLGAEGADAARGHEQT